MRKWQDKAAPDDPGSWFSVNNLLPTINGTYETARVNTTATGYAATGTASVIYSWAGKTLTSTREYVVTTAKIWEFAGASLTDRTGGVTIGAVGQVMMAQFGSATICVMGAGNATVASTGGNFAAIAGAPKGEIVVVQSNAVLIFNTDTSADGWAASDVGDYTNWTTGEASSGRIYTIPGPITAAVPFGNDVLVFKPNAIYRMTYVGGTSIKWQIQLIWRGLGIEPYNAGTVTTGKYQVVATHLGVAFRGDTGTSQSEVPVADYDSTRVYLFDGVSAPRLLNPLTTIPLGSRSVYLFNPIARTLVIAPWRGSDANGAANGGASLYHFYNLDSGIWGNSVGGASEVDANSAVCCGVTQGEWNASGVTSSGNSKPNYWAYRGANTITQGVALYNSFAASCYAQTMKVGRNDQKAVFNRLSQRLRRRTDLGSGSASLSFELFREPEDTTAQSTRTVTEATDRKRFNLLGGAASDNLGRFKVTWTNLDVEVEDFIVDPKPAGKE